MGCVCTPQQWSRRARAPAGWLPPCLSHHAVTGASARRFARRCRIPSCEYPAVTVAGKQECSVSLGGDSAVTNVFARAHKCLCNLPYNWRFWVRMSLILKIRPDCFPSRCLRLSKSTSSLVFICYQRKVCQNLLLCLWILVSSFFVCFVLFCFLYLRLCY